MQRFAFASSAQYVKLCLALFSDYEICSEIFPSGENFNFKFSPTLIISLIKFECLFEGVVNPVKPYF